MPRHFKIDDLLEAQDREAFNDFLRAKKATIDEGVEWLMQRGYKLSRNAVNNYRRNFEESLKRLRESSEFARNLMAAAKAGGGVTDIADANLMQLQIKLSEILFREDGEEGADAGELMKVAISLRSGVATKKELEELRAKVKEALDAIEAKGAKRTITAQDIADVRKAVFG
jgi:hypothetical protein